MAAMIQGFLTDVITGEEIRGIDSGVMQYMLAQAFAALLVGDARIEDLQTDKIFRDLFASKKEEVLALRKALRDLKKDGAGWGRFQERMKRKVDSYDEKSPSLAVAQTEVENDADRLFVRLLGSVTHCMRTDHIAANHFGRVFRDVAARLPELHAQKEREQGGTA